MTARPAAGADAPSNHRRSPQQVNIALDWGTTNQRAFLIGADGAVIEQREKPWGILSLPAVAEGGFDQALEGIAGDWLVARPHAPLIASGMVGSAQGWCEAPYVECPAGADDLAAHMTTVRTAGARDLMIVPGILLNRPDALPDVIRGEETQVVGAQDALGMHEGAFCFVLPGTHSKWVLARNRRIERFATYMTGEVFATLKQHSILGRLMKTPAEAPNDADDGTAASAAAYSQALALARRSGPGDLMRHLFTVRSMNLAGRLPVTALADYLSGLLIGHELVSATAWLRRHAGENTPIVLIGETALLARYNAAFAAFDLRAASLRNTAAAGLHRLITLAELR